MFYKHSSEERAHGIKFIEYLRMRGHKEEDFFTGLKPIKGVTKVQGKILREPSIKYVLDYGGGRGLAKSV